MVGKRQRRYAFYQWCQVFCQLAWRCNAREQKDVHVRIELVPCRSFREDRPQLVVRYRREIQMLVRIEVHGLHDDPELHWLQLLGALRHDDDVSPVLAFQRLAQSACGQQLVVDDEAMIVDEQDVNARFDIAVLESVVQQNDIRGLVAGLQQFDAMRPLLVHGYGHVGELLLHLVRFIPYLTHGRVSPRQYKATALPLVATAQHGDAHLVLQQPHQILHMRRLARAANGDVAYRYDRRLVGAAFQNPHFEEEVPEADTYAVKPAQRQQPFVGLDEIAFQTDGYLEVKQIRQTGLQAVALLVAAGINERLIEVAEHCAQLFVQVSAAAFG